MDIKCRKTMCCHNQGCACDSNEITVSSKMKCKSYKCMSKNKVDISKKMFEIAPEYGAYKHNKNIVINCEANCLFNKNGSCYANGITVNEFNENPLCITFIKD